MGRFRLVNLEPTRYSSRARAILETVAEIDEASPSQGDLVRVLSGYDGVITRLAYRLDESVLAASPQLRLVATATTGLDHIDLKAADRLRIEVVSLRGETEFLQGVSATAELAWGLLLALVRNIPAACGSVAQGQWTRDLFWGQQLRGKRLGIVGLGRLGSQVARYGAAFGMDVCAYSRPHPAASEVAIPVFDLEELLGRCHVISLHLPLNAETEGFYGARQFGQMRPGSILINTSRGRIVDQTALLQALETGRIAGAALDVVEDEAAFPSPSTRRLLDYARAHSNLLVTPHIGGATFDSLEKVEMFVAEKIRRFLTYQEPR